MDSPINIQNLVALLMAENPSPRSSSLIRVSEVIDQLHYQALVDKKVVPDLQPFVKKGTKRYPRWVYQELKTQLGKENFSCFGLFIDCLIRKIISQVVPVNWGELKGSPDPLTNYREANLTWSQIAYSTFLHILKLYKPEAHISWEMFDKAMGLLKKMATIFQPAFANCDKSDVSFNQEFIHLNLAGHPDIVTNNSVIDIKTVTSFKSKADRHFLQILSYTAIMRKVGRKVDYAGILLSMQGDLWMVDLRNWNSDTFLKILLERASILENKKLGPAHMMFEIQKAMIGVGASIGRGKDSIHQCLTNYIEYCGNNLLPCQIFLHGNHGSFVRIDDQEIAKVRNLVEMTHLPVYIHAPYCINPSKPWTHMDVLDKTWALRLLANQLTVSHAMGFLGVVVHTGKPMEISPKIGLDTMEASIRSVLHLASKETPLMLETPVGCGSELCHRIEDLSAFYSRFSKEEHQVFKICVDTCHVFVAGYDPFDYLVEWEKLQGAKSIGLIHFNDSRKKFGCRADGHAPCGQGNIGAKKLIQISKWGREKGIPMVTE
uniref:AP (Apurinic) endonuclease family 2 n=1 Tax=Pithovirus LCPAC201 TaxID=2506591 RepID=A0A481Z608_9VIRU|nr:MAG: AP (apurinic) endonuclease family 2 [Pithovirus LCPAC201]